MKQLRGLFILIFFIPALSFSQNNADTLVKKLDSSAIKSDSVFNGVRNNTNPAAYEDVKLDFKTYFILLGDDFKQQLTLPFHIKQKDWLKTAAFAAFTGGVALLNKPINRFAVRMHNDSKTVAHVSSYVTNFGGLYEVYALAGFYAYGTIFKTQKEKTTTALATQAYLSAGLIQVVTKFITGEQRPNYYDPVTGKNSPIWHGPFYQFRKDANGNKPPTSTHSSFPSGHTTAAFAAATVYALEYKHTPFIPIISYSAATLIGLSRLTENKHWPTDILVGGVLGYLCGKQVVNNYHRYSRLVHERDRKSHHQLSFNAQYFDGRIMPGLTYKF